MKQQLKKGVQQLLNSDLRLFKYLYFNWLKKPSFPSLHDALQVYAQQHKDVFFVMLGANELQPTDPLFYPIHYHHWKGILVEPQEKVFRKLKVSCENKQGLIFENMAISDQKEERDFYFINPENGKAPPWSEQLSSFNRAIPAAVLKDYPSAKVISKKVKCIDFDSLMAKHNLDNIDLLMMDIEGYDAFILDTIDFEKWQPDLIVFEHCHLNDLEIRQTDKKLELYNYQVCKLGFNTIGFKKGIGLDQYSSLLK